MLTDRIMWVAMIVFVVMLSFALVFNYKNWHTLSVKPANISTSDFYKAGMSMGYVIGYQESANQQCLGWLNLDVNAPPFEDK